MGLTEIFEQYKLLEYILTGAFGLGLIVFILFSSPIEKLRELYRKKVAKQEMRKLHLYKKANEPIVQELEKYKTEQQEYHERQQIFHDEVMGRFDTIEDRLQRLENSDQEQLRQLMDKIYDKRIDEKRISYHEFERYQSLYENYEAEGGNGKYATRWEEVKTWEKFR